MNTLYLLLTAYFIFFYEPGPELISHTALRYKPGTYHGGCVLTIDDIIVSNSISRNFKKGLKEFTIRTKRQYVRIKRINKNTHSIADLDNNGNTIRVTYCTSLGKLN